MCKKLPLNTYQEQNIMKHYDINYQTKPVTLIY